MVVVQVLEVLENIKAQQIVIQQVHLMVILGVQQ
jgi:hypothetical protein|tara:strand:- start:390 stop:491 length:102 start_codon:yes stop_codon:yes gene_type:complete